jgi:beta-lactamase regulating signal transducer with metallopeptidase domain
MRLEELFVTVLNRSITAGYVVIAVMLLRLLLRKAPRWIPCSLWALVGLRLVLPFSFESALSLIPSADTVTGDILYAASPAIDSGLSAMNRAVNPAIAGSLTPAAGASVNPMQVAMYAAGLVWLAGVLVMALYSAITYGKLCRRVDSAVICRGNVYRSDAVASPFVLGIIKPKIYLPFSVGEADGAYVVSHEKAHIRRLDHWSKPLGFLLLTVYWFNPLMWAAYILLCRDIELACDEAVIQGLDGEGKKAYSAALLDCSAKRRTIAACPLAFGEVGIKERVKNVLNYKKPAFWIIFAAVAVCIAAAVCLLSNPKDKDSSALDDSYAEQLFSYRTSYVGDNSAVANLAGLLNFPSDAAYGHIELQTNSEPYGIVIVCTVTPDVKSAYGSSDSSEEDNMTTFRKNACTLLALIENADTVTFRLDDGNGTPVDLCFSRDWAQSIVGADLWEESRTSERLDALLTRIQEHVESAYAPAVETAQAAPAA